MVTGVVVLGGTPAVGVQMKAESPPRPSVSITQVHPGKWQGVQTARRKTKVLQNKERLNTGSAIEPALW